jgi:hypothetical protein
MLCYLTLASMILLYEFSSDEDYALAMDSSKYDLIILKAPLLYSVDWYYDMHSWHNDVSNDLSIHLYILYH